VQKAFDDLLLTDDEMRIHDQHLAIARQALETARIKYTNGKVPQQDMLKAQVALTRLAEHMIRFDHDSDLARARLNTLLGRVPNAPLRVTGQFALLGALPEAPSLDDLALRSRPEPDAALAAPTKGEKVFGIHATLRNMDVTGDVVHTEDMDNRSMTVYLEGTTLKGAIKDAAISMNRFSKWVATADSNVTIVGEVDVSQIDAPAGITITAVASQSGTYKLASCGTLILKAGHCYTARDSAIRCSRHAMFTRWQYRRPMRFTYRKAFGHIGRCRNWD
jgi:hypothetical protein